MTLKAIIFATGGLVLFLQNSLAAVPAILLAAFSIAVFCKRSIHLVAIFTGGFFLAAFHVPGFLGPGIDPSLQEKTGLLEGG